MSRGLQRCACMAGLARCMYDKCWTEDQTPQDALVMAQLDSHPNGDARCESHCSSSTGGSFLTLGAICTARISRSTMSKLRLISLPDEVLRPDLSLLARGAEQVGSSLMICGWREISWIFLPPLLYKSGLSSISFAPRLLPPSLPIPLRGAYLKRSGSLTPLILNTFRGLVVVMRF